MIWRGWKFLSDDMWRLRVDRMPTYKAFWIRFLRVTLMSIRRFEIDECYLKASALTFYSLLSIVPVLAALFGIAKGFGLQEHLERELLVQFSEQREVLEQAMSFANSMLEQTRGGLIAGIGVIFLLWTVIKLLGNVESSLNQIWALRKTRSLARKFSDYLAVLIVCPIFITVSGSTNIFVASQIQAMSEANGLASTVSPLFHMIMTWAPYALSWFVFTFLYLFVPNGKVSIWSGLLGGLVAGVGYQVIQWIYISFQIGVAQYGAIYGSFAALPLFLVWLQTSWMIVLFGAEIAATSQNLADYEFRHETSNLRPSFRRLILLLVAHQVVETFEAERPPQTAHSISQNLETPLRLVRLCLADLVDAGVVSEIRMEESEEPYYQPAMAVKHLTIQKVLGALDQTGSQDIPVAQSPQLDTLLDALEERTKMFRNAPYNLKLTDI